MAYIKTIGTIVIGPMDSVTDEQKADGWFDYSGELFVYNKWVDGVVVEDLEMKHQVRKEQIFKRLEEIDTLSHRPIRAITAGTATDFDKSKLDILNQESDQLRAELATL